MSNGLNRDFSIWGAMKHPLLAVGFVGVVVSVASLESFETEELIETYQPHLPHFGRNMDDYKRYLQEHGATVPEKELRALRTYNCGEPYTEHLVQPTGVQTLEYTISDMFLLYIPDTPQGTTFTVYTGSAYGSGERSASCTTSDFGFNCEPTRVFGTLCDISFLQGEDSFRLYPEDCEKQKTYAQGLRTFYTSLKDRSRCN